MSIYKGSSEICKIVDSSAKVSYPTSKLVSDDDKGEVIAEYEGKINLFDKKGFLSLHSEDKLYDTLPNVSNWLKTFDLLGVQK